MNTQRKVFRVPNSRNWYYDYPCPATGKRIRKSTGKTDEAEAQRWADMKRAHMAGVPLSGGNVVTLREAIDLYYLPQHADKPGYRTYECRAALVCDETDDATGIPGHTYIHDLTTLMIDNYVRGRKKQGRAPGTINKELNIISGAIRIATKKHKMQGPEGLVIERQKEPNHARNFEREEIVSLMEQLDPTTPRIGLRKDGTKFTVHPETQRPDVIEKWQDTYDLFIMLLYTGARMSEISRMDWSLVSPDCGSVWLIRSKTDTIDKVMLAEPAADVMRRRKARFGNYNYVFPGWKTNDITVREDRPQKQPGKPIGEAIRVLGLNTRFTERLKGRRRPQSLRDTFATIMAAEQLPINELMTVMGHTSATTTMKYVKTAVTEASLHAAAKMNDYYRKPT